MARGQRPLRDEKIVYGLKQEKSDRDQISPFVSGGPPKRPLKQSARSNATTEQRNVLMAWLGAQGLPTVVRATMVVVVTRPVVIVVVVLLEAARVIVVVAAVAIASTIPTAVASIATVTTIVSMAMMVSNMAMIGRGRVGTEQGHAADHRRQEQTSQNVHVCNPEMKNVGD